MEFPERIAFEMIQAGFLRLDPDGSVWRLRRLKKLKNPPEGRIDYFTRESCPVEPHRIDNAGGDGVYRVIAIRIELGRDITCGVHRLVWQVHKGDIPPKMTVNHKDGDGSNNDISNLDLKTQSEQHLHRFRVLKQENPATVKRRLLLGFVEASRLALASGDLEPLRLALEAFDLQPQGVRTVEQLAARKAARGKAVSVDYYGAG